MYKDRPDAIEHSYFPAGLVQAVHGWQKKDLCFRRRFVIL